MSAPERQPTRVLVDIGASPDETKAKDLGIEVLPLHIKFPNEEEMYSNAISPEQFYARLSLDNIPSTSAVNPGEFMRGYDKLANEGATTIFSIHMSDKMSSTYGNAVLAKDMFSDINPDVNIIPVDTKKTSVAQWFIATKAAEMAKEGKTPDEINTHIEYMIPRVGLYAVFNDLTYFVHGGRAVTLKEKIANKLNIGILLGFDSDGTITDIGKSLTPGRARASMIEKINEKDDLVQLAVFHSNSPELAEKTRNNLSTHFAGIIGIFEVGPMLAVHGGPGVIGVSWENKS